MKSLSKEEKRNHLLAVVEQLEKAAEDGIKIDRDLVIDGDFFIELDDTMVVAAFLKAYSKIYSPEKVHVVVSGDDEGHPKANQFYVLLKEFDLADKIEVIAGVKDNKHSARSGVIAEDSEKLSDAQKEYLKEAKSNIKGPERLGEIFDNSEDKKIDYLLHAGTDSVTQALLADKIRVNKLNSFTMMGAAELDDKGRSSPKKCNNNSFSEEKTDAYKENDISTNTVNLFELLNNELVPHIIIDRDASGTKNVSAAEIDRIAKDHGDTIIGKDLSQVQGKLNGLLRGVVIPNTMNVIDCLNDHSKLDDFIQKKISGITIKDEAESKFFQGLNDQEKVLYLEVMQYCSIGQNKDFYERLTPDEKIGFLYLTLDQKQEFSLISDVEKRLSYLEDSKYKNSLITQDGKDSEFLLQKKQLYLINSNTLTLPWFKRFYKHDFDTADKYFEEQYGFKLSEIDSQGVLVDTRSKMVGESQLKEAIAVFKGIEEKVNSRKSKGLATIFDKDEYGKKFTAVTCPDFETTIYDAYAAVCLIERLRQEVLEKILNSEGRDDIKNYPDLQKPIIAAINKDNIATCLVGKKLDDKTKEVLNPDQVIKLEEAEVINTGITACIGRSMAPGIKKQRSEDALSRNGTSSNSVASSGQGLQVVKSVVNAPNSKKSKTASQSGSVGRVRTDGVRATPGYLKPTASSAAKDIGNNKVHEEFDPVKVKREHPAYMLDPSTSPSNSGGSRPLIGGRGGGRN